MGEAPLPADWVGLALEETSKGTAMTRTIDYRSHGVPLHDYELTKRDHQDQRQAKELRQHVQERAAVWRAEELADPKLGAARNENIRRAWHLITASPTPGYQIMRWRVRLYCGHIVETHRNNEVDQPRAHGAASMRCPECQLDPACIVAYEPLGMLAKPPNLPTVVRQPDRPTRKALEIRVAALQAEVAELKNRLESGIE